MEPQKMWQTALYTAAAAAGGWLLLRFLGPVLLPFGLGLLMALAVQPVIGWLEKRLELPRWVLAGAAVAALDLALIALVYILCRLLCRELLELAKTLPALLRSLEAPAQAVEQRLLSLTARFPDGVASALRDGVSEFFRSGAGLASKAYDGAFSLASGLLKKLPDLALFLLTAFLSGFMFASKLPKLTSFWSKTAPDQLKTRLKGFLLRLKTTFGGWFKAQIKLMLISTLVLTAGFLILGVGHSLLLAAGIALIDALPVLGTGLILIPWGLWMFLQGDTFLGAGLLCLYGAAALIRTALEPRLLGKQMGLDPLLTLLALYAGYRFFGVLGMILFPMAAMLLSQFWTHMEKKIDN